MASVNPYLTFNGDCEAAFNFYRSVFGGDFPFMGRFGDMPSDSVPCPPGQENLIMHVSLPISRETILMGSDASDSFGGKVTAGNNFSISINTDSQEEADRLFIGLSAGGHVGMPMEKTFWGAYFGMFTDKFGISWMVNYDTSEHKDKQ